MESQCLQEEQRQLLGGETGARAACSVQPASPGSGPALQVPLAATGALAGATFPFPPRPPLRPRRPPLSTLVHACDVRRHMCAVRGWRHVNVHLALYSHACRVPHFSPRTSMPATPGQQGSH